MSLAFLPLIAAIVVMACAPKTAPPAGPPGTAGASGQQSRQGPSPEISVRVVVASRTSLEQQCKEKKFASVDILIDETPTQNEPYHCIGVILMPHHQVDQKFAPPENQAIVRVHKLQGQTVRWYSDTTDFMIYRIEPQHPKGQQPQEGPANPFMGLSIPTPLSRSITSGQLVEFFAKPKSDRRYKMILRIGKELREIDPDVWCQP